MNTPKKLDRRVRRTRRALGQALLDLLLTHEYDTITIQDVADRADLNRATFYLHYDSKEALLIDALETEFDELVARMEHAPSDVPFWEDRGVELLTFRYVAEHAPLYRVLLSARGTAYIVHRIIDYIAEQYEQELHDCLPGLDEAALPVNVVSRHAAGALYALLSWWVTHDMPHSPEYMAQIVGDLSIDGLRVMVERAAAPERESASRV